MAITRNSTEDIPCWSIIRKITTQISLWENWAKSIKENLGLSIEDIEDIETKYEIAMNEVLKCTKELAGAFPNIHHIENITIDNEKIEAFTVYADDILNGPIDNDSPDVISIASRLENTLFKFNTDCLNSHNLNFSTEELETIKKTLNDISHKSFSDL